VSAPTGFHSPIDIDTPVSLSAYRARRQKPYPDVCDHLPAPEPVEQPNGRAAAIACFGVVAFLFLIAAVVLAVRALLKG
jgi:hypothetical protein